MKFSGIRSWKVKIVAHVLGILGGVMLDVLNFKRTFMNHSTCFGYFLMVLILLGLYFSSSHIFVQIIPPKSEPSGVGSWVFNVSL